MRLIFLSVMGPLAVIASPASAGKTEDIAACMWEKMPAAANDFISAADQKLKIKGLMDGLAVCADGNLRVNTKKLEKLLIATRPSVIGSNSEAPKSHVCIYENGVCKSVEDN